MIASASSRASSGRARNEKLGVPDDRGEDVAEVVGEPAGRLPTASIRWTATRRSWARSRSIAAAMMPAAARTASISGSDQTRSGLVSSNPTWPHHVPKTTIGARRSDWTWSASRWIRSSAGKSLTRPR
jgi:hypothetical protein